VTVLNDRGAVVSGEAPAGTGAARGTEEERNVARFFETRIRRALEGSYPPDAIDVTVWAAVGPNADPTSAAVPIASDPEAKRDFRIRATVAIASPLTNAAREQISQWVRNSIGFDAGLGDAVTVTASAPMPAADDWGRNSAEPAAAEGFRGPRSASAPSSLFDSIRMPLVLLALVGILLFLLRRRPRPAVRMDEQDRIAFAANLKALLARRDLDDARAA
jgi:hypothetical protein